MIRKTGKILILILFLTCHTIYVQGQTKDYFTISNARTLPKGKWESGLIQPCRIGISKKTEIYSSILATPLIPNVGIKMNWINEPDHLISTMHSLSTPSPFLNISSASGVGGLIPPEFDFPFILSVSNSILISKKVFQEQVLTFRTDFVFAVRSRKVNPLSTIDLPVFYPRMAHYYEGTYIRPEINISGPLLKKIYYEQAIRIFLITREKNNFFWENNGFLIFGLCKKCFLKTGYILSYGEYPYGNQWQLWPALDFLFGNVF